MNVALEAMAIEMPPMEAHPNRVGFGGVLTRVDEPSDKPPSGARGHRVMLPRDVTERALASLLGMALDYAPELDRHDARRKVGIITSAEIVDGRVEIGGYLFARDFPEIVERLQSGAESLGMSYEIADVRVEDVQAPVWVVREFTFTGAAVLRREKAAYARTWVKVA